MPTVRAWETRTCSSPVDVVATVRLIDQPGLGEKSRQQSSSPPCNPIRLEPTYATQPVALETLDDDSIAE